MMKKLIPFLFLPLLFLSSCGVSGATKVADAYHDLMKNEDYMTIVDKHISEEGLELTSSGAWIELFESVKNEYGKIESIEKVSGFNSKTSNGKTTLVLRYHYTFTNKSEFYERLIFMKSKGKKFKIAGIAFNEDLGELPMPK